MTGTGRHDSSRQFASSMVRPRKTSRKDAPKATNLKKKVVVEVDKLQDSAQAKDGNLSTAETSSKPGETHQKKRILRILTKAQMKAYPKADSHPLRLRSRILKMVKRREDHKGTLRRSRTVQLGHRHLPKLCIKSRRVGNLDPLQMQGRRGKGATSRPAPSVMSRSQS